MKPNFELEKKLYKKGFKIVIGVDEVGRGSLAGPVVAGTVFINLKDINLNIIKNVKDSKQLSEKQREEIYKQVINCKDVEYGLGVVSEKIIDKINILNATKLAMQKAVKNLYIKLEKVIEVPDTSITFILVDGNMKFDKNWFGMSCDYKSIVKGDQKVLSIALASIIAKVYRDNLMKKYAKKYPQYGFDKHKGYGTKLHYENLKNYGLCKIHRKTFIQMDYYGKCRKCK